MPVNFEQVDLLISEGKNKPLPYVRQEDFVRLLTEIKGAILQLEALDAEKFVGFVATDITTTGTMADILFSAALPTLLTTDRFILEISGQAVAGAGGGTLELDINPTTGLLNHSSNIVSAGYTNAVQQFAHNATTFASAALGNNAIANFNLKLLKVATGATNYAVRARFTSGGVTIRNISYVLTRF
jgi:hypothetical protein